MYLVKKLNVVKEIAESRLAEYERMGFKVIKETPDPEPTVGPTRFPCPHCDKDYATEENLQNHIREKHPETLLG